MAVLTFEDSLNGLKSQQGGFLYFYLFPVDGSTFSYRNVAFLKSMR